MLNHSDKSVSVENRLILCLINGAAYSRAYFEQLAPYLKAAGYRVAYALDSHLSDVLYANGRSLNGAWYFTDYVKSRLDDLHDITSADTQVWSSLFSDFDRFLTMNIDPPLKKGGRLEYKYIPLLLEDFFEKLFSEVKFSAVLYEPVSNSFAMAAYQVSKKAGVPFCSLSPSRIPGRIEVSMTGALHVNDELAVLLRQQQDKLVSDESRFMASKYIASIDAQMPDYMKTNGLDKLSLVSKYVRADKWAHFIRGWRYRRRYSQDCALAYQHGDPVALSKAYVTRAIKRRLRLRRVRRHYLNDMPTSPFMLYPLHFHPEASTSIYAADYVDELSVIKAIAFRLPVGVELCVKEHPSAVALQPLSFYRQLSALPNVKLLAASLPTKSLIRQSCGLVCLTSTAGFEAAVLNKPVIVLGNVFYSYFPNVRTVAGYQELSESLKWALSYEPVSSDDLLDATAAYVEFGAPGAFDFKRSLGDAAALEGVAALVAQRLAGI